MPKILIIDDDDITQSLYKTRLEIEGYEVVTSDDGKEGLSKLTEGGIDLILLNWEMPKFDGIYFLTRLGEDALFRDYLNKPVISISTNRVADVMEAYSRCNKKPDYYFEVAGESLNPLVEMIKQCLLPQKSVPASPI
jgi:CheY-like chemotaxis protein